RHQQDRRRADQPAGGPAAREPLAALRLAAEDAHDRTERSADDHRARLRPRGGQGARRRQRLRAGRHRPHRAGHPARAGPPDGDRRLLDHPWCRRPAARSGHLAYRAGRSPDEGGPAHGTRAHRGERMSDSTSIARSSAVMAGGTLASRVLGLLRQLLTAAVVGGTGLVADAWTVGNALPNIFHLLLAGGVLNAVIVPQITGAMRRDDGEVFVNRLLTIAITAMAVATVALTLAAPFLVWLSIDSSWGPGPRGLAIAFAFICLPQMFFYGLYTLLGQVLTANSRFAMFMWAPAVANVVAIAGLGWLLLQGNSTDRKSVV